MLHVTIMAGGAGTRFWPASRADFPKQLLALANDERSMIQATLARVKSVCPTENVCIVTNERLVEAMRAQLPELPDESIIGEPCKRDTAPCVALAALFVERTDPDGTMAVMPADHLIEPTAAFVDALQDASDWVETDSQRIVTFGIKPNFPATVYGYIERGQPSEQHFKNNSRGFDVVRFREKPDRATAEQFLQSGEFYWNSGIFVWKARTILDALRKHAPELMGFMDRIADAMGSPKFDDVFRENFNALSGTSIDFAVMEHHDTIGVIEAPFQWDDVGNWTALERLLGVDAHGNAVSGRHLAIDCENVIIRNDAQQNSVNETQSDQPHQHLLALVGMQNCIVVRTPDATLIVDKSREADVKMVVEQLRERGWSEYL